MARTIDAGSNVRRTDIFLVDPREIEVDWTLNGRTDTFTPERVARLAASLLEKGQLQPCTVRSIPGSKRVKLVAGYNRLRAALQIVENDPNFKLSVQVRDGVSDQEAFELNVIENMIRSDTSIIDNAENIKRFITVYGYENERVAELYKRSGTWVSDHLTVLTLPRAVRDELSAGAITLTAALKLARLPEAEAVAALAEAEQAFRAEQASEQACETDAPGEPFAVLPLEDALAAESDADADARGVPALTVEDADLAAAIENLPGRPRTAKAARTPKPLTPKQEKAKKARDKAAKSKAVGEAAARRGVKNTRSGSDLRKFLTGREDEASLTLLSYLDGTVDDDGLARFLDAIEVPCTGPGSAAANGTGKAKGGRKAAV